MQYLVSDNTSPAHPDIINAITEANEGYEFAYSEDRVTQRAQQLFREHFSEHCHAFFASTGTACNMIALKTVLEPYEAVICAHSAHMNRDECGAPEAILGTKLLTVDAPQGKLTPQLIKPLLEGNDMVHRVQPRVVSIAQCTEWGTVYSIKELEELSDFCHSNDLLLHIDGARLSNAACYLNASFKEICLNGNVDLISFGGTKNGLMGAEAMLVFDNKLAKKAAFIQKQMMHLSSKMRFISAQFIGLLSGDLWKKNATHANQMASFLAEKVNASVEIVMPVQSNVIFAKLPSEKIAELQKHTSFIVWDSQQSIVRWMTSYDTSEQTITSFADKVIEVCNG